MAVHVMAVGKGSIKERLYQAFIEFVMVAPRDFPPHLRDDFISIRNDLTKNEPKQRIFMEGRVVEKAEGRIGATLLPMRLAKAVDIAERIVRLRHELADYNADRRR